jgi:hypothetical protein
MHQEMSYYRGGAKRKNFRKPYENKVQPQPKKIKKLDMRKSEEFNFMLSKIILDLPDSIRGSIAGGIYAAASRQGISEARNFVLKKQEEGIITERVQKQIVYLLNDYSTYR